MLVLNFKYVVFSFLFLHLPIFSYYMISMMTSIDFLQRKMFIVHLLVKYKILEIFAID